ncbi:uncharacterized protein LOC142171847 [Nicotiana tabacum]|uniref:Uncharacterized protein LOC142171847 n=1 Tax=Nicotiana tabacum TaxID=4097 RepID=A0AC58T345_TOBAC
MGYMVYVELKKENREFGMYPLCITTLDKEIVDGGGLFQRYLMQLDATDGVNKFDTVDTLTLVSLNSGEPIEIFEPERDLIISNTNQKEVMAGQVFKDKATLKAVMEQYAIAERFQLRVDRSNAIRLTIVVDGSHLKSAYTGTFVSASTLDGAAYGVVDSENDVAWLWFFEQFKVAYGERENMYIVSDRNESIIKSLSRVHEKLSEVYFSMEKVYTKDEFDSLIEKMQKIDIRVKDYLELAGYKKWANSYAPVNQGWTMTSNIAESINSALVSPRELPIYDFLEEVRKMFGRWNCSNRKEASHTYTTIGKIYQEILTLHEALSTHMSVSFVCYNYLH